MAQKPKDTTPKEYRRLNRTVGLGEAISGALDPALKRNDVVLAHEVVDADGGRFPIGVGVDPDGPEAPARPPSRTPPA